MVFISHIKWKTKKLRDKYCRCFQIVDKGDVELWVGDLITCHVSFDSLIELEDEQRRLTRADKSKWGESWKTKRSRERRRNRIGPLELITVTNPTAVLRLAITDGPYRARLTGVKRIQATWRKEPNVAVNLSFLS